MKQEQKVFLTHRLKTIEIDAENRTFKVNGEDFGNVCTGFEITCNAVDGFKIKMEIDAQVKYANYDITGNQKTDKHCNRR